MHLARATDCRSVIIFGGCTPPLQTGTFVTTIYILVLPVHRAGGGIPGTLIERCAVCLVSLDARYWQRRYASINVNDTQGFLSGDVPEGEFAKEMTDSTREEPLGHYFRL